MYVYVYIYIYIEREIERDEANILINQPECNPEEPRLELRLQVRLHGLGEWE